MAIFRQEPIYTRGIECRWDRQKSRFSAYIWLHCVLWTVPAASAIHCDGSRRVHNTIASKRPSLLMAINSSEVHDKKPQRYAEDNVIYVTQWYIWSLSNNNKKNSARVIILLRLTTDGHKASRGLSATVELLVCLEQTIPTGTPFPHRGHRIQVR